MTTGRQVKSVIFLNNCNSPTIAWLLVFDKRLDEILTKNCEHADLVWYIIYDNWRDSKSKPMQNGTESRDIAATIFLYSPIRRSNRVYSASDVAFVLSVAILEAVPRYLILKELVSVKLHGYWRFYGQFVTVIHQGNKTDIK